MFTTKPKLYLQNHLFLFGFLMIIALQALAFTVEAAQTYFMP